MTQKDKELLLKDLCARLPYGVKILDNSHKNYGVSKLINIEVDGSMLIDNEINDIQYYPIIDEIKPYFRPMSSMTEEEKEELNDITVINYNEFEGCSTLFDETGFDWLNAHHFDYRGLIQKGLALEAPDGMYNSNKK